MSDIEDERILYITYDGLLQHLGYSQVVRYLQRLSDCGPNYTILSLERHNDLEDRRAVERLEEELATHQIEWVRLPYRQGLGAAGPLANQFTALQKAATIAATRDIGLVHARSYLGGATAYFLKKLTGVPYLFDIRGYWIDERIGDGRWFTNPVAEAAARRFEKALYASTAGVVTLTDLSGEDISNGQFGPWDETRPMATIPTCADYECFRLERDPEGLPQSLRELHDSKKLVVGFVGSINPAYYADESIELFRYLHELRDDVHLVALTNQKSQMRDLLRRHDIPGRATTILCLPHHQMPQALALMDWGFLLLTRTFTRRASMPTKLAEFFASGVRPIHFGCNSEVRDWVQRAGTGITLSDVSPSGLRAAARRVANSETNRQSLEGARDKTRAHFGLAAGIRRYEAITRQLLGHPSDSEDSPAREAA